MKQLLTTTLLSLIFAHNTAWAQIPQTLSYQGLLTDNTGAPVANGSYNVTFNFYTTATDGTVVQSRTINGINTYNGLFTTIIGNGQGGSSNTPLNNLVPALGSTQYYVGVQVNNGTELAPRMALTAVPYAFAASTLDASTTQGSQITGNNLDGAQIKNSITTATLPAANITGTITNAQLASGIDGAKITGTLPAGVVPTTSILPVGTIVAFASGTVPTGWLECNGSAVSRTTYSALFTTIGVSWGAGDASTTFMPDLRGSFLRGWDHGAGNDPDAASRTAKFTSGNAADTVGSYQLDAFQGHKHNDSGHTHTTPNVGLVYGHDGGIGQVYSGQNNWSTGTGSANIGDAVTSSYGSPRYGQETRPINANVMYLIKVQ